MLRDFYPVAARSTKDFKTRWPDCAMFGTIRQIYFFLNVSCWLSFLALTGRAKGHNPLNPGCVRPSDRPGFLPPTPSLPARGDPGMELAALAECDHWIAGEGHFGFWAATLGGRSGARRVH